MTHWRHNIIGDKEQFQLLIAHFTQVIDLAAQQPITDNANDVNRQCSCSVKLMISNLSTPTSAVIITNIRLCSMIAAASTVVTSQAEFANMASLPVTARASTQDGGTTSQSDRHDDVTTTNIGNHVAHLQTMKRHSWYGRHSSACQHDSIDNYSSEFQLHPNYSGDGTNSTGPCDNILSRLFISPIVYSPQLHMFRT